MGKDTVHICPSCRTLFCEWMACSRRGSRCSCITSLRLFLSPYFSISVAMHYLKTYPDSIGISHYLCYRMKSMKTEDVEFYWPQMW